jgi:hypothetical protein
MTKSKRLQKIISQNKKFLLIIIILAAINGFLLKNIFIDDIDKKTKYNEDTVSQEILQITATRDPKMQAMLYKRLIERVGPLKAQEDLYHSGLPFDGETHLLNHTVGDWLYEKFGTEGLIQCKDYFLSSCYHGFVIKAIAEKGKEILPVVMKRCWKEGTTVAVQCAHGIGHGFLAWEGYKNLPNALKECDKIALESDNFPLYNCHDGVFMENLWAVHEDGRPSPDRWIDKNEPVFPCNSPLIEARYHKACWSNQPHVMYQHFKGDLTKITPYCLELTDNILQVTCFDAIARQINPLARGNPQEVFRLCAKMPAEHWQDECVISNVRAFFSVGDHILPLEICRLYQNGTSNDCWLAISGVAKSYIPNEKKRNPLCQQIPDQNAKTICLTPNSRE